MKINWRNRKRDIDEIFESEIERIIKKSIQEGKFRDSEGFIRYFFEKLVDKKPNSSIENIKEEMLNLANNSQSDFWEIGNVEYRGKNCIVHLAKGLLPDTMNTYEDMIEFSRKAKENGNFYIADIPLYHSIFTALYNQYKNDNIQEGISEIKEFMKQQLKNGLYGLSKIKFMREVDRHNSLLKIIHNRGGDDEHSYIIKTHGGWDYMNRKKPRCKGDSRGSNISKSYIKAIFGTGNREEIGKVYGWLNGKNNILIGGIARDNFIGLHDDVYYDTGLFVDFRASCFAGRRFLGVRVVKETK